MPKRYKDRIDFLPSLLKASISRINDTDDPIQSESLLNQTALLYLNNKGSTSPSNYLSEFVRSSGAKERIYLKDFKFAVNALNSKINSTVDFARLNSKDIFSTLYEIQRQVYKLDVEVGEAEIKMLNGFSKVHLNTFVRQLDSHLQYRDKSWITDFKTSFSYPEKYLLHLLPSSGVTLPRKHEVSVPIIDAYIVDEYTDVGDTLTPVISTSPRNVFLKNKIFKHILVRKNFDETSRKYKSKTLYDNYPYSATSQLALELVLPNVCMINYLKVNPVNAAAFNIKDIIYLNEAGEQVSIVTQSIDSDLFATYLFEPIYTKNLRVIFEQASTVTKTTSIIGDMERQAIADLLEGAGFTAEINADTEEISGRWYDFSIKNIEVGEIGYENKGIYRSKSIKTSSPIGFEINRYMEAITPEELFSEYYKTITLPEGKALSEAYVGVRLLNKQGGRVVDSLVPVADSYPTQIEFLDFLHTDARVKLFPDLEWHLNDNCINQVDLEEICVTLDDLVPDYEQEQSSSNDNNESTENDTPYDYTVPDKYQGLIDRVIPRGEEDDKDDDTPVDSCLLPGERVIIDDRGRTKNIEDFSIGDSVYTYDYRTRSYGEHVVTGCMEGVSNGWLEIYFDGVQNPIRCSLSHHMLNGDFEQVPAFLMEEGDTVWYLDHDYKLDVTEISEIVFHDEEVEVYNIEVEDAHTYLTANGVLQHNKTYDPGNGGGVIITDPSDDDFTTIEPGEADVASPDEVTTYSSDIGDTDRWKKNFSIPINRNLPTANRAGTTKTDNDTMEYVIGESYNKLDEDSRTQILNNPTLINQSINMNNRLMIGSDGRNPGYTRVRALHIEPKELNLIGRNYWNTKLVEVKPTVISNTNTKQEYDVNLSQPRKNLSTKRLRHLSPVDRIEVKKTARIQDLASKIRTALPDRAEGPYTLLKAMKDSRVLDNINSFVNSVFAPKIGYRVNDRGAIELGLVDDLGSESKLYANEIAARTENGSFGLGSAYQPWKTIVLADIDGAMSSLIDQASAAKIDPDQMPATDTLEDVSDCIDFLSFTTENPHGLREGDIVTLTSSDSRFSGIHVVALVEDEYTFYIALESFTGLVNTFGISLQDPDGNVWSAVTSDVQGTDESTISVSMIVDDLAEDHYANLLFNIRESMVAAGLSTGFRYYSLLATNAESTEFELKISPNPSDSSIQPTQVVGSLVDNGCLSFSDWSFDGTNWVCSGTINSLEDIYAVDALLTQGELNDLQAARICIWNQDVDSPIELYEDDRLLKIGVDYSISLDDKSTWYDYWLMPGETSYNYLNKRAKAGRFYVRVHNRNPHAIYWIKYRVKRNQALSACEQVRLKNGRVVFDKALKNTFGTLQTVFIFRTNSTNPYITPILREYSLRIQERDNSNVSKSNLAEKEVSTRSVKAKRNVS